MKFAIQLDPDDSHKTLDRAATCHEDIVVEVAGDSTGRMSGQLVTADEQVLIVVLFRPFANEKLELSGRYVDVQILAEDLYTFTTDVISHGGSAEPRQLVLRRPERIFVFQRRHNQRARLAPSTSVRLTRGGDAGSEPVSAALLNLSTRGLACRVRSAEAASWPVGTAVDLCLEMPDSRTRIAMSGIVQNRTDGADAEAILGLEFSEPGDDPAAQAARQVLHNWLYERRYGVAESEVGV